MTEHKEIPKETKESSAIMTSFLTRKETVLLDDARRVIAAGEDAARATGRSMHFAVVDAVGDLVVYARMDGAWVPDSGEGTYCGLPRHAIELTRAALAQNSGQKRRFVSIKRRDATRVTVVLAAAPLRRNMLAVGAVGVCGVGDKDDSAIAASAAGAFQ
jgi:uncharacterized protein GlcG (DUF336 family)